MTAPHSDPSLRGNRMDRDGRFWVTAKRDFARNGQAARFGLRLWRAAEAAKGGGCSALKHVGDQIDASRVNFVGAPCHTGALNCLAW
jgi:hypothetical protein